MTLDNSTVISAGAKAGPIKVEGSINLGQVTKGIGEIIEGRFEYMRDIVNEKVPEILK